MRSVGTSEKVAPGVKSASISLVDSQGNERLYSFSMARFSFILVSVFVFSLWGLASTSILIFMLWSETLPLRAEVSVPSATQVHTDAILGHAENLVSLESPSITAKTGHKIQRFFQAPLGAVRSDSNFDISEMVLADGDGGVELQLTMKNRIGKRLTGFMWARAVFLDGNDHPIILISALDSPIDEYGHATKPRSARQFSIEFQKRQILKMMGSEKLDQGRLQKVTVGIFYSDSGTESLLEFDSFIL